MSAVLLDVVIPVHGVLTYLRDAVDSALAQRGVDVRVTVVDDGNDVDVEALVSGWGDPRLRVVAHEVRRGIGAGRNTGAAAGDRPWLAFLDGDDLWPVDRTERLRRVLSPDARPGIAVGRQRVFDDGHQPDPAGDFDAAGLVTTPIPGATLMSRAAFELVGPFDEDLRVGEMVDWMARARELGVPEHAVACVSLLRRSHPGNVTSAGRVDVADYLALVARARRRARAGTDA